MPASGVRALGEVASGLHLDRRAVGEPGEQRDAQAVGALLVCRAPCTAPVPRRMLCTVLPSAGSPASRRGSSPRAPCRRRQWTGLHLGDGLGAELVAVVGEAWAHLLHQAVAVGLRARGQRSSSQAPIATTEMAILGFFLERLQAGEAATVVHRRRR